MRVISECLNERMLPSNRVLPSYEKVPFQDDSVSQVSVMTCQGPVADELSLLCLRQRIPILRFWTDCVGFHWRGDLSWLQAKYPSSSRSACKRSSSNSDCKTASSLVSCSMLLGCVVDAISRRWFRRCNTRQKNARKTHNAIFTPHFIRILPNGAARQSTCTKYSERHASVK